MEFFFSTIVVAFVLGPIVLLIILFVRVNELSKRVQDLERQRSSTQASAPAVSQTPQPVPTIAAPPQRAPDVPASQIAAALHTNRPPTTSRSREEWEALIGGKLLNRIGALALIIAVGFFLKYAFDNNWITETMRVLIGILIGAICLLGGHRTQKKGYSVFAQGLVGAGISILYLSLYASFNFYQLIPQWLAFLLMSGVTLVALVQALAYDSITVSLLGWAGGYLTPIMLSTGESNELALFTYIALLALGLLALSIKKESWIALEMLTLVATVITFFAWYDAFYTSRYLGLTCFFATLFWLLFHGSEIVRIRLDQKQFKALRHVVQSLNACFFYVALYYLVREENSDLIGSVAFALGIVYAATLVGVQGLWRLDGDHDARYGLMASAFLLIGTSAEFQNVDTARLWSLEGLFLLWLGLRSQRPWLKAASLTFYLLAIGLFSDGSLIYSPLSDFKLLWNERALTGVILAAAAGLGTLLIARSHDPKFIPLRPWLGFAFFMILFILLTVETNDHFRQLLLNIRESLEGQSLEEESTRLQNLKQLSLSGLWLFYSILLMVIGILRGVRGPRLLAIGLFGLAILKIFIVDLSFLQTLYRIFSFFGLGVILLAVSYMYQRYKSLLFGETPAQS